jgi:Holliday junction DNA helicase RuvA
MFSRIAGTLLERTPEGVVLEAGGLGYEIVLPPCVAEKVVAKTGERVTLEVYSVLSIDKNSGRYTYYGFTNAVERAFFEALLSVSSIGPRSAARAFSQSMSRIASAIDRGDHAFLKTLPGIGQQKARDIVAKLQGKIARFLLIQEPHAGAPEPIPDFAGEALAVLLQLEYSRAQAETMIRTTLESSPAIADAESLLAEIYRQKAKKSDDER